MVRSKVACKCLSSSRGWYQGVRHVSAAVASCVPLQYVPCLRIPETSRQPPAVDPTTATSATTTLHELHGD